MAELTPEQIELAAEAFITGAHDINLGLFVVASGTDAFLLGILILQVIDYWKYSYGDKWLIKTIVIVATTSTFVCSIYIAFCIFKLYVFGYGRYTQFMETTILPWSCLLDVIPSTATQLFFGLRAYRMSKNNKMVAAAITLFVLISAIGGLGTIPSYILASDASNSSGVRLKVMILMWLCGAIAADGLIMVVIMRNLLQSRSGWKSTDRTVNKLMTLLIETQIPPTICMLVFLITYLGFVDRMFLDVWAQWTQSKFYVCGLMASLNSRYFLRRAIDEGFDTPAVKKPTEVHVITETHVARSEGYVSPISPSIKSPNPFLRSPITEKSQQSLQAASYTNTTSSTYTSRRRQPLDLEADRESEQEDRDEVHKMDYLDNPSRTGLTEFENSKSVHAV
ncbi:hypothetical protein L202_04843 [Cryptococcus amylolentus CBS 6039]|uniref:DUF6534 domain-containing protein n=2 Tax=Cryptococcus amylolentus TaxID=104669 RepID=A0A1E3HMY4_9TREE|nr:hypothetical protein L202_04843 [Cryptococcus amylolentus CBS 6039]ODN77698.1 hypothetical protein L202_04843 [Cryptococcus amylolentus CBS 6039]ODO05708.1 hypothetical protein I350_04768 [Cryptococcus amylolentus CBS 6273]